MKGNCCKVAIIIPYFGTLPNYFNLWLESVGKNKCVDVLFFTDNNQPLNCPSNVYWKKTTFSNIRKRAEKLVDFPIVLDKPYKLCDYRPAYGLMFQEYLKKYQWWGWGDIDTIWGDLTLIITDKRLEKYDKILDLGHLTLMKNNYKMKNLWKQKVSKAWNYEDAFRFNLSYHFDEGGGLAFIARKCGCKIYSEKPREMHFADILPNKSDFELAYDNDEGRIPHIFTWNNGCLMGYWIKDDKIKSREFAYIHLQKRKMKNEIHEDEVNDGFIIIPNQFLPFKDNTITSKLINSTSTNELKKSLYIKKIKYKIINYFKFRKFKIVGKSRKIPLNGNEVYFNIEKAKY